MHQPNHAIGEHPHAWEFSAFFQEVLDGPRSVGVEIMVCIMRTRASDVAHMVNFARASFFSLEIDPSC